MTYTTFPFEKDVSKNHKTRKYLS